MTLCGKPQTKWALLDLIDVGRPNPIQSFSTHMPFAYAQYSRRIWHKKNQAQANGGAKKGKIKRKGERRKKKEESKGKAVT